MAGNDLDNVENDLDNVENGYYSNKNDIEGVAKGEIKLKRTQDLLDLSFAGYSFIIGAGIFSLMPHIIKYSKGYSWLSFVFGGIISILTGLSFARLNMEYPVNDAEYSWFKNIVGSKEQSENSPRNTFARYGANTIIWIVMILGFCGCATVSAGMKDFVLLFNKNINQYLVCFLALFTPLFINTIGSNITSDINKIIMSSVTLAFIFIVGIAGKNHNFISENNFFDHKSKADFTSIAKGAFISIFAFNGFQSIVQMSEEAKKGEDVPKAMVSSVTFSTILYSIVAISIISILGLKKSGSSINPFSECFKLPFGNNTKYFVTVLAIICMFSTMLISIFSRSRLLKKLAERKIAPQYLERISTLTEYIGIKQNENENSIFQKMPINALLTLGIGSFLIFCFGQGFLVKLASYSSILIFIIFSTVHTLTILNYYKKNKDKNKFDKVQSKTVKKFLKVYPFYSILGLITTIFMLFKSKSFLS